MAADAPPTPSSLVEWELIVGGDQMKQQEDMTKFLEKHGTVENFIEACKKIGQTAVAIEGDFRTVKNSFTTLDTKYNYYFPDIRRVYVPRWDGLMARWNGGTGMLLSSKNLAIETANALTDYGKVLALIADIKTQGELEGAQSALRTYVANHPIDIATKVADGFKNLRIDLQDFSDDFAKYVGVFCPSTDSIGFSASLKYINQYQETITNLNVKVQESAMALGCSSVFGVYMVHHVPNLPDSDLASGPIGHPSWFLPTYCRATQRLLALQAMQKEFLKFKPNIINTCDELSSFANIWAFATLQSFEINVALDEGMVVLTRKKFQLKLELLIVQIEPLRNGLRAYAAQI
ncbi:hypothetical protein AGABI1DRAFT_131755 [Agaricus bisporus var. burnettii JB137-S8]|uniref:Uncharacterized protein n=1 Tax=Agaricus bisporus var. burnettii (strain JB137-S8 / ATCC MYA-4627 / FGSC 10392) TaxID=597362 RepID=K5VNJ9_AGABU|nr:uncharacterized protein AGABI1DRAFT_131755 [Agaricus bisporus var. burnettii JB137-S8]EKM76039.1 hypothetical protein AGABI1DRAFT_131755 [Agaricus bisporus var. burnettii JB137-S8]